MRAQLNRILVSLALLVVLPAVAVTERIGRGKGRRVALGGIRFVARICGVSFEMSRAGDLDPKNRYVFVPNHSSPMDIAAMLMALPEIRFLAAADLFRIPLLSAAMRALDTVPIERRDPAVARQQLTDLIDQREENDSYSLVIFPEGGIAPRGERLPFKTGAFALAIQTGMSIVPVLIIHSDDVLPPKGRLAVRSGKVIVKLFAPISSEGLTIEDRGALRDRARDVVVNAWEACERDTTEHA